ncbi:MAG: sensor histidine kinase, partial [Acidobacteria bacterium]|nr:sensor histidine kinase [Acidobacteriota bacterium]
NYLLIAAMVAMGLGLGHINQGSAVFIIFAASFIAWVVENSRWALACIAILVVLIGLDAFVFHAPIGFWTVALVVSLGVGLSNIYWAERKHADQKLVMAHEEIEHLAKVAERERIARDLHDVLGHALSTIIVKSTLANRLLDKSPQKARQEIADIEKVSRGAMAEIRSTLRGYSSYKLGEEIERAKATLNSAGICVESRSAELGLSAAQESVVSLIMREAVTNVVRHAQARNCVLRVGTQNGNCVIEIEDDGRGGFQAEGNGVRGMRERIEALGGTLARDTRQGTRLKFEFPLHASSQGKA